MKSLQLEGEGFQDLLVVGERTLEKALEAT